MRTANTLRRRFAELRRVKLTRIAVVACQLGMLQPLLLAWTPVMAQDFCPIDGTDEEEKATEEERPEAKDEEAATDVSKPTDAGSSEVAQEAPVVPSDDGGPEGGDRGMAAAPQASPLERHRWRGWGCAVRRLRGRQHTGVCRRQHQPLHPPAAPFILDVAGLLAGRLAAPLMVRPF